MPRGDGKSKGQDATKEIRLIELVRENPELYDYGHPHYKDNNQKKIVWEYISEEMNTPVENLKKIWKKLRLNYTKKCRDLEAEKMTKSTPCDEALAFLMTSVMEYANENSCGNISVAMAGDERTLRSSSSQLTAITEEEKSTATPIPPEVAAAPEDSGSPGQSATSPQDNFTRIGKTSDRVLRPRHSEPSRLPAKESVRMTGDASSRRLTGTPTTPSSRSRNRKLILDPNDSTRIFFDSMAITVGSFPQHLQATVKLQICKIVSETECNLSSPKIP